MSGYEIKIVEYRNGVATTRRDLHTTTLDHAKKTGGVFASKYQNAVAYVYPKGSVTPICKVQGKK